MSPKPQRPVTGSRARRALQRVGAFVEQPYVTVAVGLVLAGTAGVEVVRDVEEGLEGEHGVMVLGFVQLFKGISALAEGFEKVEDVAETLTG